MVINLSKMVLHIMFTDQYLGIYNIISYLSHKDKRLSFTFSLIAKSSWCAKCSASNWVQNESR